MDTLDNFPKQKIHIWLRKRNARKTITTIEGLDQKLDFKKIVKVLKKSCYCGGNIEKDTDSEALIIHLTGDQRKYVVNFLVNESMSRYDDIVVHGY